MAVDDEIWFDTDTQLWFQGAMPIGFRFVPSHRLLVELLTDKALGRPLPLLPHEIKDGIDIYRCDPDHLPIEINDGNHAWDYFFVKGVDFDRRTPGGCWKVTTCGEEEEEEEVVGDGGRVIGFRKEFLFYSTDGVETLWKMDEFRLNLETDELKNKKVENYVVCEICKEIPQQFQILEEEEEEDEEEGEEEGLKNYEENLSKE